MSPLPASVLGLFLVAGLLTAQPPKDPPPTKEPTHDGKSVSEWVEVFTTGDAGERQKATTAILALARSADDITEKFIARAAAARLGERATMRWVMRRPLTGLGPAAVPALTQGLWSGDRAVREACADLLGSIGGDARAAAPAVLRLLHDTDKDTRKSAVATLARIGAYPAIPTLKARHDALRGIDSLSERRAIVEALTQLGADAGMILPMVHAGLKDLRDLRDPENPEKGFGSYYWLRIYEELGPEAAPAVPVLVQLLAGATADEVASYARALGSIGPAAKEAVPALKKKLEDTGVDGPEFHGDAGVALWRIAHDPDAVKSLRWQLGRTRHPLGVAEALWRIDPGPDTVAALEGLLKSDKPEAVVAAAGVLGTRSKDAVPLLAKMLAHKDSRVRARAVVALARIGPGAKDVLDAIRGAAKDDDPQIAFWATATVCRIDPTPAAIAAVARYLTDRDPEYRVQAAEVLGALGTAGKPAVAGLTASLTDADDTVKQAAAVALWRLDRNPAALPAAEEALRSADPQARERAATDIGYSFGADAAAAVPALTKRLFDSHASVRCEAAAALARIGPGAKAAAPALLAVLDGDHPHYVMSAACEALGLIAPADKDAVVAALKSKLTHPEVLTRAHAALALWHVAGDKTGEKEAERGLGSRSHQARITAAEALWRIRQDDRVVPLLLRALEDGALDGLGSDNERYMAVRALGRIGSAAKPAVPELVKLLTHHDPALAAAAADALKAIDPDAAKKAGVK